MKVYVVLEQYPRREIAQFATLREAELFKNDQWMSGKIAMPLIIGREVPDTVCPHCGK